MTAPTDIPNHLVLFLYFVRFVVRQEAGDFQRVEVPHG
jgi:hypothetical protein